MATNNIVLFPKRGHKENKKPYLPTEGDRIRELERKINILGETAFETAEIQEEQTRQIAKLSNLLIDAGRKIIELEKLISLKSP